MPKRFYVYVHMDINGKPLYVGKGTGTRFMEHMEREEFANLAELQSYVRFVDTEDLAKQLEYELVMLYGLDNLVNKVMPSKPIGEQTGPARKSMHHDQQSGGVDVGRAKHGRHPYRGMAMPADVSVQTWDDFVEARKLRKMLVSAAVVNTLRVEGAKIGWSLEQVLQTIVMRGWSGFQADWVVPQSNTQTAYKEPDSNVLPI